MRCFIAVECNNEELVRKFIEVQRRLERTGADLKSVEPENIHLTLKFLGDIDDHEVEEVSRIIEGTRFDSFEMRVEGVGVFPHPGRINTIWAGVTEGADPLTEIFEDVDVKLSNIGFANERKRFHPHLTLCRVRSGKNRDQLAKELDLLKNESFGVIYVDKIVLKKSDLTPKGPIYSTLAESQ